MIKDIELIPSENGCYDWNFGVTDIKTVTGDARLKSAVIHAVLLKPYELSNSTYENRGNVAYEYVKANPTPHVKTLICENIRNACKEINGIYDATVDLQLIDDEASVNIKLIKENGEEVNIDEITL